jgi:hypothetical protein
MADSESISEQTQIQYAVHMDLIKNFSQISRPLTDLMPIPTGKKEQGKEERTERIVLGRELGQCF